MIHIPWINGRIHDKLTQYDISLTLKCTNARSNNGRLITDWQYYYYVAELTFEMITQEEKDAIEKELQQDFTMKFVPTDATSDISLDRTFRILESKNVNRGEIYDLTDEVFWRNLKIQAECLVAEVR